MFAQGAEKTHPGEESKGSDSVQDGELLPAQVKAVLTAMTYHRSKAVANCKELVIAIAHGEDAPAASVRRVQEAFDALQSQKVCNKPFRTVTVPYKGHKEFAEQLKAAGAGAVFLIPGDRKSVRPILNVAREIKILSFTVDPDYVHWLGVSLGVESKGKESKVMINLSGCENEGVEFDARLLRMAEVFF